MYAVGAWGIGQTRRAIRLAEYLKASYPDVCTLVVTGVPSARTLFETSTCTVMSLNALSGFVRHGVPPDAATVRRSLLATAEAFDPDVFVSTTHAGPVGEVLPVLQTLRRRGCRRVLALRDIYWPPRFEREFERLVPAMFEDVVVGGPDDARSRLPRGLEHNRLGVRVTCVGYLRPLEALKPSATDSPSCWCQVGGGRDGYALAAAFLDVAPELRRRIPSAHLILTTGILMSEEDRGALAERCSATQVTLETWVDNPVAWGRLSGGVVISMAGYNSCVEAAWYGSPTIICPRRARDDDEQRIRAAHFADSFGNVVMTRSPEAEGLVLATEQLPPWAALGDPYGDGRRDAFADPGHVADLILGRA